MDQDQKRPPDAPVSPPEGGAPHWPPPGPPGWPPGPAGYGRPGPWPPPRPRGFFRSRPLLVVFLLFVASLLIVILLGAMAGQGFRASRGTLVIGDKVGVVKIEGVIFESKPVVDQLRRFRDDKSVKAVTLRIESPGGSVGASQEIHDEVKKLAAQKPVVVSMGNVAASGGYYAACPAQVIYANPGTLTGSIGVVMQVVNLEELMAWLKIKEEVIKSGDYKDIGNPFRKMTSAERELLKALIDDTHQQFIEAVFEGRKDKHQDQEKKAAWTRDHVAELADGRILTGLMAKELGLVDKTGTLWDAIEEAARLAGIKGEPRVVWPPRRPRFWLGGLEGIFQGLDQARRLESPVRLMFIMKVD